VANVVKRAATPLGCIALNDPPDRELGPRRSASSDGALVQFSSGSTGEPKGALLTNAQILSNVDAIRGLILKDYPEGPDFRHVAVCWLPLYHDMGLIGCVFTALAQPADLVLIPPEVF